MVTPVPFAYRPPTPLATPKFRRVLIAQRDTTFGRTLWEALTAAGFGAYPSATREDALSVSAELRPDIALVDLELSDDGLPLIEDFARRTPPIPSIVITNVTEEKRVLTAIRAGAVGYVFKEDVGQRTVPIVEEALRGGTPLSRPVARLLLATFRGDEPAKAPAVDLTPREKNVLEMLARGKSYADVGATLGVSENTVRSHVRSIYEKLGASSKTEAVMIALRMGLLRVG